MQLQQIKSMHISAQLSKQHAEEQACARESLGKVFESIRYLARQGLAIRGHDEDEGNLMKLLVLRSADAIVLKSRLNRATNVLSHDC